MIWFLLSLFTALAVACRDLSIKVFKRFTVFDIAALELFWALPVLISGLIFVPVPNLDSTFWWSCVIILPLNLAAYILYLYAIKLSPISLSVPFLSFTPVFMLITGLFVLNETTNLWGGLGVGLIVLGSYVLHLNNGTNNFITPFFAIAHEKGSWFMGIVALLYAFSAVFGKKAILHSSPLFFSYSFFLFFNIVVLAGLLLSGRTAWRFLLQNIRPGLWLGGLLLIEVTAHGFAISMTTAVYMIAVKRSSILFSVLLSWLILKEGNIKARGLGTLLMFCGVLLITLLG